MVFNAVFSSVHRNQIDVSLNLKYAELIVYSVLRSFLSTVHIYSQSLFDSLTTRFIIISEYFINHEIFLL